MTCWTTSRLRKHVCLWAASLLGGFEKKISFFGVKGVSAPVALSVFSATEARPLQQALADTLRPGSSRSSSRKKSAPGFGRCAADEMEVEARGNHLRFPNFEIAQGGYFSAAVVAVGLSTA